ncbi:MAG: hypothetical protein PVG53_03645 [Holophagae bacterium]
MGTDRVTRARIAAMTAAEAAFERNARDPFAELEQASTAAAQAVDADPEAVYRIADELVLRVFRAKLSEPNSLQFLCPSCGAPLPDNRPACRRCKPNFPSDEGP